MSTKSVVAKSYGVLHSGYLGLQTEYESPQVGSYDPANSSGAIELTKGTQSEDLKIRLESWLRSSSITLKPSINTNYPDEDKLTLSSSSNWMIKQGEDHLVYRISAAADIASGIYYIDWDLTETKFTGISTNHYTAPVSTLVEVCDADILTVSIADIPSLYKGYDSIPIKVSVAKAPDTQLIVTPTLSVTTNISVNPTKLTFGPDITELYFEISVNSTYESAVAPTLTLVLSGTDSAFYRAPTTSKTITFATGSVPTDAPTITLGTYAVKDNAAEFTIKSSQNGVLYWQLGCFGIPEPTFDEVKALNYDLIEPNANITSLSAQLMAARLDKETEIDPEKDTDIAAFFRRQLGEHCSTVWVNSTVVYANVEFTASFDWLYAGAKYQAYAFVDNKLNLNTAALVPAATSFTFLDMPDVYTHTITLAGNLATISAAFNETLYENLGVNPEWITGQTKVNTGSRMLAEETVVTHTIVSDRGIPTLTPDAIIKASSKSELESDLKTLTGFTTTVTNSPIINDGIAPAYKESPSEESVTETTATFSVSIADNGIVCVVCADPDLTETGTQYSAQVTAGLDSANKMAPSKCGEATIDKAIELVVTGLEASTDYDCWFTACNDYPLWPTCQEVSETTTTTTKLTMVSITTDSAGDRKSVV